MKIFYYVLAVFGYAAVGFLWGFIRWKLYVDDEIGFYEAERARFLLFHRIRGENIPEFLIYEWRNYVKNNIRLKAVPPKAIDFRGEIAYDVICWPLAMFFLIVQISFRTIMKRIMSEYNRVTNNKIDKIRKDLNLK
jgi:hypothetical protein